MYIQKEKRMKVIYSCLVICAILFSAGNCFCGESTNFSLPELDGKRVKFNMISRNKIVVLNFWASWCSACREEIPILKKLQAAYGEKDVVFLGINIGENEADAKRFIEKYNYPYRVLMDKDRKTVAAYGLLRLPTTIVVAKNGNIIFKGPQPPKTLIQTK
jgi:thiol-disulfide isomerase/thioredoxin